MRRLVGPAVVKCHLGRTRAHHEDNYPLCDSIKKAPIREAAEWGSFRSILARPMLELELETSGEAVHTMHVEGQISRYWESMEGPQVMFFQMVKQARPGSFTKRHFQMWCFVMGHSAVSLVQNSIVCKINELWLVPGAELAWSVPRNACCCRADFCRVTVRRGVPRAPTASPAPSGLHSYLYCGSCGQK